MSSSKRFKQDCDSKVNLNQTHQYGHKHKDVFEWKEMYDDGHLVDFTIKTSGQDIHCHRAVLITKLPYFKAMYDISTYSDNGRFESSDLSHLHPASLKQVIEYAYTSEISCSENNIEELVEVASYLQADDVIEECDAYLEKIVNRENSLRFFIIGSTYSLRLITKKAHKLVLKHFARLINTVEFPKLHVQNLWTFLQDDHLNVPSEEVVFNSIFKWMEHDSESRQQAAKELLKSVRLDHLSEAFLTSLLQDEKYESILPIKFLQCVGSVLHQRFGQGCHSKSKESSLVLITTQQPRFSYSENKLLIIGGTACNLWDHTNIRDCMYWNMDEESWTKFTELPDSYTNCHEWSVCAGDGRIFVSGGFHIENEPGHLEGSSQVWMWHNNSWKALPPMIHGRWSHGFVYADRKLFVFGGKSHRRNSNQAKCLKSNEFLDLKHLEQSGDAESLLTLSWQKMSNMKFTFHSPQLSVLGDSIYMSGMVCYGDSFRCEIYHFSISKRALKKLSIMPMSFRRGVSATVCDNIYVFGNSNESMNCVRSRYTPSTDTWCNLSPSCSAVADKRPIEFFASYDCISPLTIFDGKILLVKLMRQTLDNCTQIMYEYNVEENRWSQSSLNYPPSYFNNRKLSLICAAIKV